MKVKKYNIFYFLLIFFLLKPTGLEANFPFVNSVMNILRFFSMIYSLYIYILYLKSKKGKFNRNILIIFIIQLIGIFVSLYNNYSPYTSIVYWQSIISVLTLYDTYKLAKKNYLRLFQKVLFVYVVSNFLFLIFNFNDIDKSMISILGAKNMAILYIYPLIILEYIDIMYNKKIKLLNILSLAISILSQIIIPSSTSLIALLILVIFPLLFRLNVLNKLWSRVSSKKMLVMMLIFFVLIVVCCIQKYFYNFLINNLHKDITFTGRTYIWDSTIKNILNNPFGYGWDSNIVDVKSYLSWKKYTEVGHAHNFILNLGYKNGILCAVLYLVFLIKCAIGLDKGNGSINIILKLSYLVFLVISMFEAYPTNCMSIFLLLYICTDMKLLDER